MTRALGILVVPGARVVPPRRVGRGKQRPYHLLARFPLLDPCTVRL